MPRKRARILCDQSVPRPVVVALQQQTTFVYDYAFNEGVSEEPDSALLDYAEQHGYPVLLTPDQRMRFQQNFKGRKVSLVILGSNDADACLASLTNIVRAIKSITKSPRIIIVPIVTPKATSRRPKR